MRFGFARSSNLGLIAALVAGLAIATPALGQQPPGRAARATLGDMRAQLFYQGTGRLSENIAPPSSFAAWNVAIGGGSAEENANDLLVSVEVRTSGEQNVSAPLVIEARDGNGRVLGRRRIAGVLTSQAGRSWQALWLSDVGCAGTVNIRAQLGTARSATTVILNCGE